MKFLARSYNGNFPHFLDASLQKSLQKCNSEIDIGQKTDVNAKQYIKCLQEVLRLDSLPSNTSQQNISRTSSSEFYTTTMSVLERLDNKELMNISRQAIKEISVEELQAIHYPGVDAHVRNWKFSLDFSNCSSEPLDLVILVPSAPGGYMAREIVRNTWGSREDLQQLKAKLYFVIGQTPKQQPEVREMIEKESRIFHDVVQLDMIDSYHNLTLKTVGMLEWAVKHCQSAKFIAKIDDDVMVNFTKVIPLLHEMASQHIRFITGSLRRKGKPLDFSKWRDPIYEALYHSNKYPHFIAGPGYLMTNNFIDELLAVSRSKPFLHLEDVFITGICAREVNGLKKLMLPGISFKRPSPCQLRKYNIILAHDYQVKRRQQVWTRWHTELCH